MAPNTTIQADVDEQVKAEAVAVLKAQGLSMTDFMQRVISVTLKQIAEEKRLPHDIRLLEKPGESLTDRAGLAEMKNSKNNDLKSLPGFGMWADRDDMKNPAEWVRNLRKPRFQHDT
jgi:addiction module RelB/DinJ family antitoxin